MSFGGNKTSIKSRWNAGQAAIEYILLLAITIAVILLFKEFYKQVVAPKLNYALGGYIECLLETGQLPSIRDAQANQNLNSLTNNDSKCKLPTGSFSGLGGSNGSSGATTGGTSYGSSGGTTSSGTTGGSSGGTTGSSGSTGSSGGTTGSGSGGGSSPQAGYKASGYSGSPNSGYNSSSSNYGSGGSGGGGGGGEDERDNPTRKKRSTVVGYGKDRRQVLPIKDGMGLTGADGGMGPGDGKVKEKENAAVDDMGDEYGRGGRRSRSGSRYRGVSGAMQAEFEKQEGQKARITTTGSRKRSMAAAEELGGFQESRRSVNPPPPRAAASLEEVEAEGLSFGNIFKYLLIAGIVIAIIVFFGGQVMNYNNSQEK